MNLRDGVFDVRMALGEAQANLWSDDEIIRHLNQSARRMCNKAQSLKSFDAFETAQITLPDGSKQFAQEYILPIDIDELIDAKFWAGSLFPLKLCQEEDVQIGARVGGLPFWLYVVQGRRFLTHQTATGICKQDLPPNDGGDPRTIIGLYPMPTGVIPIYLWYLKWHQDMKTPFDEVMIPNAFGRAWIAWAVARCKEKESAITEAQYWDGIHDAGTQEYVDYMMAQGQSMSPATFTNRPQHPAFLRGLNTVIVVPNTAGLTSP